jgi:hypothetical protein
MIINLSKIQQDLILLFSSTAQQITLKRIPKNKMINMINIQANIKIKNNLRIKNLSILIYSKHSINILVKLILKKAVIS